MKWVRPAWQFTVKKHDNLAGILYTWKCKRKSSKKIKWNRWALFPLYIYIYLSGEEGNWSVGASFFCTHLTISHLWGLLPHFRWVYCYGYLVFLFFFFFFFLFCFFFIFYTRGEIDFYVERSSAVESDQKEVKECVGTPVSGVWNSPLASLLGFHFERYDPAVGGHPLPFGGGGLFHIWFHF